MQDRIYTRGLEVSEQRRTFKKRHPMMVNAATVPGCYRHDLKRFMEKIFHERRQNRDLLRVQVSGCQCVRPFNGDQMP